MRLRSPAYAAALGGAPTGAGCVRATLLSAMPSSFSLFKAVRCGEKQLRTAPVYPIRSSVKSSGKVSRANIEAPHSLHSRRGRELIRLYGRELPEAAGTEVGVAPVALLPGEHAEEPSLPAAASTGCHEGSTPCGP